VRRTGYLEALTLVAEDVVIETRTTR
jgi:hypothetical protein